MKDSAVLGKVGEGYKMAIDLLNEGRIGIGAQVHIPKSLVRTQESERWGAGVEYHFQEFNEPYAPSWMVLNDGA